MTRRMTATALVLLCLGASPLLVTPVEASETPDMRARFLSSFGWVRPGDTYPFFIEYDAGAAGTTDTSVAVTLPASAVFVSAQPAPASGDGRAGSPLVFALGPLAPGATGRILVHARAMSLDEDPEIVWKDLSAEARLSAAVAGVPQPVLTSRTMGPKATTLTTARFGERPFPLVMVEYQDVQHCTGVGQPYPECTGNHTAAALDAAVNSRTSGKSLWQLYNDMSFGQLSPTGAVNPADGSGTKPFEPYPYKFSSLDPNGFCAGVTAAEARGTPAYPNRVRDGWYVLPGNQGYYGSDSTGNSVVGVLTGIGPLVGIDDGCGPTGKIAYDAAAMADPDVDYNEFDTDKDGVVDFINVAFAGKGANNVVPSATSAQNIWPHKSDLQFYFTDENGQKGYVSNDQLKTHTGVPLWWTDATRKQMTTDPASGLPVYVRVGPYNVNPETAIERMSVIAHEYGHSLGLPDFYSVGGRSTFGSWELMASDYAQFMTVFARQELGWIVPREAEDGVYTLRESKTDTGSIEWTRPDGAKYTLTGPGIHNADALRVDLPRRLLIEQVPSGTRAWHSGSGNNFDCPPEAGHLLDVFLPDLAQHENASSVTLRFQSFYEIEWDYDYGFVLVSADAGQTWQSLPSKRGTTVADFSPHGAENLSGHQCYARYNNGITGVSGQPNSPANPDRFTGDYATPVWIEDEFDLTAFKGRSVVLRFVYATDPGLAFRGWFVDDIRIDADGAEVYASDFESSDEANRLFPRGWARVSSADGVPLDHAYYVEVRDRVSWDKDGKLQSDRGTPTWQPGVAILYTDENHGYGNVGVDDQPAQTIVDSVPQPGNENPALDDAAFTTGPGRSKFDGCTHVDNYDDGSGQWKLPEGVNVIVSELSGLSTDGAASNASATLLVDVQPDCSTIVAPPALAVGAGYQDPDPDGSYELLWTRPSGAVGPDQLQEATTLGTLAGDDAESGLGRWTVTGSTLAVKWTTSPAKTHGGSFSFWTEVPEHTQASATMTFKEPISIPAAGSTVLTFWEWYANEIDDKGEVQVSEDGVTWATVYTNTRAVTADDAAILLAEEPMSQAVVDLTAYRGRTVRLRFVFTTGTSNFVFYTPYGWYVDDLSVQTSNWYDVFTGDATSFVRSGLGTGTYHYRVRTSFPAGTVTTFGPWSDTVTTRVERVPDPQRQPNLQVTRLVATNHKGRAADRVSLTATITNAGDANAAATTTEFRVDGVTVLGQVATPGLAPGGSIEVTVQWDVRGLKDDHTVLVTADHGMAVLESSEVDNTLSRTFNIKGARVSNP